MTTEIVGLVGVLGAAFISGVFALLAKRFREENAIQHEANHVRLSHIGREVGEIKSDIEVVRASQQRHLEWHAEQ